MNKKYLLYAIIPAIALTSFGAVAYASQEQNENPMAGLVSAIAKKFNLQESDVQTVFNEYRETKQTQMQARRDENMADALKKVVTDGKITQAQSDLITAKKAEVDAAVKTLIGSSKTKVEVKTETKKIFDALSQWAKDNNIDQKYLRFIKPDYNGGKPGKGFGKFPK